MKYQPVCVHQGLSEVEMSGDGASLVVVKGCIYMTRLGGMSNTLYKSLHSAL